MSAPVLVDRARMPDELELVQAAIAERLRQAGVCLPDAELASVSGDVLAEALRVATAWLER